MEAELTLPYDHEGLWSKTVLFLNRSYSALDNDSFEEAALWASFALELLGKAALSKVSPLLIADPDDNGKSLLIAAGISQDVAGFKSVPAKAVFSRCARAFPPFNAREADRIAANRNDDVHSAALPFAALPPEIWWQRYWAQAVLLVSAQDRTLEQLVGAERVGGVEEHLAKNRANVAARVQALIARAHQRLALMRSAAISARAAAELAAAVATSTGMEYETFVECPACTERASLLGDYAQSGEIQYDEDDGSAWEELQVYAAAFACTNCGLTLEGPEFLAEAELPDSFEAEREYEPEWDDYGNE